MSEPSDIIDLFSQHLIPPHSAQHGIWYDYPIGPNLHFRFTQQSILCSLCKKRNHPDQYPCETLQISFYSESPHIYNYCSECLRERKISPVLFTNQSSTK